MLQEFETDNWTSLVYLPDLAESDGVADSELTLNAVGKLYSNGKFVHEQVSTSIAVHVIEAGAGTFEVDGKVYSGEAGDLIAFFPGSYYRYADREQTPWRYSWFRLGGFRSAEIMQTIGIAPESPYRRGDYSHILRPILDEAAELFTPSVSASFHPRTLAWRIVSAIASSGVQSTQHAAQRTFAESARMLMDEEFTTGLTVDELARRLGVVRSTLFRQFRQRYRVSPKTYLDTVRIDRAVRLLRQSDTPVHVIAALCGFQDSHYFSRAYKRARGITPSEERVGSLVPQIPIARE